MKKVITVLLIALSLSACASGKGNHIAKPFGYVSYDKDEVVFIKLTNNDGKLLGNLDSTYIKKRWSEEKVKTTSVPLKGFIKDGQVSLNLGEGWMSTNLIGKYEHKNIIFTKTDDGVLTQSIFKPVNEQEYQALLEKTFSKKKSKESVH